ncbi:hypothetical protein [Streptomyces noursei]|uniref:hypothetical protein n=1 Tax=Streptomyces noursei TaxID=1971 RepID=UPI00167211C9|nr:hypothetical protein [Streptomyces noursei]MCZ1013695.1 hypothetical protein [Streptomyces noursei]GGX24888.1 hypothetical protein GCM10010341_52470 [Streptomyces noursei]
MSIVPWTIERIREALASPSLARRFDDEMDRAPADERPQVFAKWQRIAGGLRATGDH